MMDLSARCRESNQNCFFYYSPEVIQELETVVSPSVHVSTGQTSLGFKGDSEHSDGLKHSVEKYVAPGFGSHIGQKGFKNLGLCVWEEGGM